MNLRGARVLITGGSLGIGKATAKLLIEQGAKVAITGRRKDLLEKTAKELGAFPIHADVAQEADVFRTYQEFLKQFGKLDVLVNNAGTGAWSPIDELNAESFQRVFDINILGAALMAREAAKLFKAQKSGNIINIASTAALKGHESGTIYVASKFALRGMTECWRAELRKYNVRVILINPSEVTTAFGSKDGSEREEKPNRLRGAEVAHAIKSVLEMDDRGFVTDLTIFATNPF